MTYMDNYGEVNLNTWLQDLRLFIDGTLKNIIPNQNIRQLFIDKENMKIWAKAFTHETVSPTENYEDLEFLGDALLKAIFPKYLMQRLPFLHKNEYTELNVHYMSKMNQGYLSQKLGFGQYIRTIGLNKMILNVETDVFEAFFGALDTISEIVNPNAGAGFINCFNMIIEIFSNVTIDIEIAKGSAKTQVLQIFVRFDLSKPIEIADNSNNVNVIKFFVCLEQTHIKFLAENNKRIQSKNSGDLWALPGNLMVSGFRQGNNKTGFELQSIRNDLVVIGFGQGSTKKEAEDKAYDDAIKTLNLYGINTAWAKITKHNRDFSDRDIQPFLEKAFNRLENEGFVDMNFYIPRKTVTAKGAVVQLRGVRENGSEELLTYTFTTDRSESYRLAKAEVVGKYANNEM